MVRGGFKRGTGSRFSPNIHAFTGPARVPVPLLKPVLDALRPVALRIDRAREKPQNPLSLRVLRLIF